MNPPSIVSQCFSHPKRLLQHPHVRPPQATTPPPQPVHQHKRAQGFGDSEFGAFVSVPPSQDPMSLDFDADATTSLAPAPQSTIPFLTYFAAGATTAAERNRRDVLDKLLEHQDDASYFLNSIAETRTPPSIAPPVTHPPNTNKAMRPESRNILKGAPTSKSTSRVSSPPLPKRSCVTPIDIITHRIDHVSPLVLLPTTGTTAAVLVSSSTRHPVTSLQAWYPSFTFSSSAPNTISHGSSPFASAAIKHGSPFASTPYIPPSGAPVIALGIMVSQRRCCQMRNWTWVASTATAPALAAECKAKGRPAKGKGVTLLGRREGTIGVLNEEIADLLRPRNKPATDVYEHSVGTKDVFQMRWRWE
ncbi:hypothetical protein BU15DRAFT_79960 [Melanogaster broomeanus]|nr:hypothetical protein BU15DRAFT_79960 [Melanogaster broomeanus]